MNQKNEGSVTEAELAGLSDEERAALTDEGDDDADTLRAVAGEEPGDGEGDEEGTDGAADGKGESADDEGDDEQGDDDGKGDDAGDGEGDGAGDGAAAATAAAATDAGADDDDASTVQAVRYNAAPVEKYDEQMATLNDEMQQASAQFKAGDIEIEDFLTKQGEINAKRDALRDQKVKHDISVDFNEQRAQHEWQTQCRYFMRDIKKDEGIDYAKGEIKVGERQVKLLDELDKTVKILANDPDNAQQSNDWLLNEAHEMVKARYRLTGKAKPAGDAGDGAGAGGKPPQRKGPNLKSVPTTLRDTPTAASDDAAGDGEFAHLDKLDGMELENAVARLNPEQQKRWAEG